MIDFAAAQRPDTYIANSNYTKLKIKTYYRKDSVVVYPPIDTNFFTPQFAQSKPQNYFLCVGRLTPEKKFDHAIAVAEKLGLNLVVVGTGSDRKRLERITGKHTTVLVSVSKQTFREL